MAANETPDYTNDSLMLPNGTTQAEHSSINCTLSPASSAVESDLIDDLLHDICTTDMQLLDDNTLEQYKRNGDEEPIPSFISAYERVVINLPNCMVTETPCNKMPMITHVDSLKPTDEDVAMNGEVDATQPADANIAQPTNKSPIQSVIARGLHQSDKNKIALTTYLSLFTDPFFTANLTTDISDQPTNEKSVEPTNEIKSPVNEPNLSTKEIESISTTAQQLPQLSCDSEFYLSSDDEFTADVMENTLPSTNNNCDVSQPQQKCGLCGYESVNGWKVLSKHYVRHHPDAEMPTARLPKAIVPADLEANPIESTATYRYNSILIKSTCLFCSCDYVMSSANWLQHFVAHTGEYEYKCNGCQCRIIADVHKRCNSTQNIQVMYHELKNNQLFAFTCNKCNYTQLSKENLKKHIDSEHQILVTDDLINEILLINCLKISNGYNKNDGEDFDCKTNIAISIQAFDPIILSSDESDPEDSNPATDCIDLTLSGDESN